MPAADANNPVGDNAGATANDQDWRLEAELDVEQPSGALHSLVGRFHGPDLVDELKADVPEHVVVTHDGRLLFAYASDQQELAAARRTIEETLCRDGIGASIRLSRWQDRDDRWVQVDPPLSAAEEQAEQTLERDEETIETRTMAANAGKWIRREFEETMLAAAAKLELQCSIAEHPHLLDTQVVFTVTGPRRRIDEFAGQLSAENWSTVRADGWLAADAL